MKKLRFYVFPYRDFYFARSFGPIVRDLMIIDELAKRDDVDKVYVFNRPLSIHEVCLGKKNKNTFFWSDKIKPIYKLSCDPLGPLFGRAWSKNIYYKYFDGIVSLEDEYLNVVLDFLPIGRLPPWALSADIYWYDLIDNFTKHNRYNLGQKKLVQQKYALVNSIASIVTGVSDYALDGFTKNTYLLENGLLCLPSLKTGREIYDFGFMGFVTDKMDVDKIFILAGLGYSVAIFGEFYDKKIERKLSDVPNVFLLGKFLSVEAEDILGSFKVGLIPYRKDKLHDESPLKLYQYLAAGKTVLSSCRFNHDSNRFYVYDQDFTIKAKAAIDAYHDQSCNYGSRDEFNKFLWSVKIDTFLQLILNDSLVNK